MKNLILTAALAATLVGCAAPVRYALEPLQRPPFPEAEYATLPKSGKGTVSGQAFMKTVGGDVKLGAGSTINLNPVTSYSKWASENRAYAGGVTPYDPRLLQYMRQTIADGSGRFSFKDVPDGEYFVTGAVTWQAVQGGAYPRLAQQGGVIWKMITVKNGESVEVMLTQ